MVRMYKEGGAFHVFELSASSIERASDGNAIPTYLFGESPSRSSITSTLSTCTSPKSSP
jgi:hypothetical protein